jgi:hypothetical protein
MPEACRYRLKRRCKHLAVYGKVALLFGDVGVVMRDEGQRFSMTADLQRRAAFRPADDIELAVRESPVTQRFDPIGQPMSRTCCRP